MGLELWLSHLRPSVEAHPIEEHVCIALRGARSNLQDLHRLVYDGRGYMGVRR